MQPGKAEDQRMVVTVREKRLHRQDAVSALAILHHHRLAPFLREPFGEQSGGDVHTAAGAERRDHADGVLRPLLRHCKPGRAGEHQATQQGTAHQSYDVLQKNAPGWSEASYIKPRWALMASSWRRRIFP